MKMEVFGSYFPLSAVFPSRPDSYGDGTGDAASIGAMGITIATENLFNKKDL